MQALHVKCLSGDTAWPTEHSLKAATSNGQRVDSTVFSSFYIKLLATTVIWLVCLFKKKRGGSTFPAKTMQEDVEIVLPAARPGTSTVASCPS